LRLIILIFNGASNRRSITTENNFPANAKLAQQNANISISLNQNNPIVNDATWAKEIAERNPRVAAELTSSLNSLRTAIITQSKPASI